MTIQQELLAGRDPSEVFTRDGLLDELKRALAERMLDAELDQHLASERARLNEGADGEASGPRNCRNGHSRKTVLTGTGQLELAVPRDRQASFEPRLIAKYRRRFPEFDDKVVSLYARGMTVRGMQGHLRELYGVEVSPDLVSPVLVQAGDGCGAGTGGGVAEPPAGCRVCAGVLRRVAGQDQGRGDGPQQGRVHRARRAAGR